MARVPASAASRVATMPTTTVGSGAPSLFDRVPAVYAFCREHLFRDDTPRIVAAVWPHGQPEPGTRLLELGCGPGFYARRLAARFPGMQVVGLDRSPAQLARARARLIEPALSNCEFQLGDATALRYPTASLDVVVASRLLAAVEHPLRVIAEAYRVLAPGGRCFVAEPRSPLRAAIPIRTLRLAARLASSLRLSPRGDAGPGQFEDRFRVLEPTTFVAVIRSQPWAQVDRWTDGPYQYAVLEKGGGSAGAVGRVRHPADRRRVAGRRGAAERLDGDAGSRPAGSGDAAAGEAAAGAPRQDQRL